MPRATAFSTTPIALGSSRTFRTAAATLRSDLQDGQPPALGLRPSLHALCET